MRIEMIATGDELMSGLTRDGNFFWAGDALNSIGLEIAHHTTVGDDREEITEAFRAALGRADAVIVSGGLGPTSDDLTAEVAARFFGAPLALNEEGLQSVIDRLRSRGRELTEKNKKQAFLPEGSRVLANRWGTAPGFSIEREGTAYYFLPGVPREFQALMKEYVMPDLDARYKDRSPVRTKLVRTYGLPESEVARMLDGVEREGVRLGYRSHFPEIHLRLTAYGDTDSESDVRMSEMTDDILDRLGGYVFSTEGETLEEVVGGLLRERGMTLSTAESCTGGLIAHRITNIPGSSDYFLEGVISYSNDAKMQILGVPKEALEAHGAVSAPVVEAMARGVRGLSGSGIGVAVSGIAGPSGGTEEKPVGTVFIGLDQVERGVSSGKFLFYGTREQIKLATSEKALDMIRKILLNNV
jgi:nicotinamide-nucleotide amidase